jgi:hypothetical protein
MNFVVVRMHSVIDLDAAVVAFFLHGFQRALGHPGHIDYRSTPFGPLSI